METAKIVRLRIKNFLGISDVEITPGQINQIVGQNNQGKTSILRALGVAAEGTTDGAVVRHGEEAAEILVDLSDETTIRRRIRADGKQSTTVSRGQFEVKSPQSYLDALFDHAAFNPLDLLDPKRRNEAIMEAIPITVTPDILAEKIGYDRVKLPPMDYSQHGLKVIDALHRYLYQRRAEANKEAAEKAKRYEVKNADLPPMPSPITITADQAATTIHGMTAKKATLHEQVRIHDTKVAETEARMKEIEAKNSAIIDLEKEQAGMDVEMERKLTEVRANFSQRRALIDGRKTEMTAAVEKLMALPAVFGSMEVTKMLMAECDAEIQLMKNAVKDLETMAAIKAQHQTVREIGQEADAAKAFADALTAKVNLLAGPVKQDILSAVEMPIAGLTYLEGEFLLDGVRVENLSSSKALQLAIAIARKHAKKVKIICIDGAEALDQDTWDVFVRETKGDGFTYFVTKVGDAFHTQDDPMNPMTQVHRVMTMHQGQVLQ